MKVIIGDRRTGRTTELIRLAAEEHLYIVCPNMERVQQISRLARKIGADIPQPLFWDEFAGGAYYGKGIRGFLIDDLDHCLQSMTAVPILAVVLEGQDFTWRRSPGTEDDSFADDDPLTGRASGSGMSDRA